MRRFWNVCQETLNLFLTDVLSCFACVIIDNEKMCLSLRYSPICFLIKIPSALAFLSSLPVVSDSSSKKYASHSFTPVLRKRKIGRKLRSYEYFLVMLRSTGACIFLYKKRKLKKNYRDFYIFLDIL